MKVLSTKDNLEDIWKELNSVRNEERLKKLGSHLSIFKNMLDNPLGSIPKFLLLVDSLAGKKH